MDNFNNSTDYGLKPTFLVRWGWAKSESQAKLMMIAIVIICIAISVFLMMPKSHPKVSTEEMNRITNTIRNRQQQGAQAPLIQQ